MKSDGVQALLVAAIFTLAPFYNLPLKYSKF